MKKILLLIFNCIAGWAQAQQSAQYTQYTFNGLVINPAYAGSKEVLNVSGMYRSQWTGLEGAPTTQTISLDGAVAKNHIGLGLHLFNDQLGAQGQKSIYASTAFRVNVGPFAKIALGLAGGASEYFTDGTRLHAIDKANDPTVPTTNIQTFLPDAKAGLFFNTERFFVGLSAAHLIGFKNKFIATPVRHYFLTSGYVFNLSDLLKFKPSFLLKEDFKSPGSLDLNAYLLIGDRIWLGGTYRTAFNAFTPASYEKMELRNDNSWALISEIYLTPKIKIGYAHDFTLTNLRTFGSNEISVGFFFYNKEDAKSLTIRYF